VATKKYKVKNTNILHNGDLYKIGDVIELDDTQAKKLQDVLTAVKETAINNKNQNKTNTPQKNGGEDGK
jgi:hypothetical protein